MTAAVQFLWSVLLSLGLSVSADNIGDTFSTIYSNQDAAVQQRIDFIMRDPVTAATIGAIEFTSDAYMYSQGWDRDNPDTWVIDNNTIQNSIGSDAWNGFVQQNQNNVASTTVENAFSCGEYSFEYGATYSDYTTSWHSDAYVKIYCNGELVRDWTNYGYGSNIDSSGPYNNYINFKSNMYFDSSCNHIHCYGKSHWDFCFDLSPYIDTSSEIESVSEPSKIGTAGDYSISADGTITLPDGTVITPNADGTYTIDGNVYSPSYNLGAYSDPAISSLLNQILQRLSELEQQLEFEQELDESYADSLDNVDSYSGTMSEFLYTSPKWTTVFPFCIPWDFVRGVKLLSSEPVAPVLSIPFEIPSFGSFNGYKTSITLDFADYEKYFVPVRWFSTIFFLISLGFITFKIVKGAT